MYSNKKHTIIILLTIAVYFMACQAGGEFTGREYMPDMAHSVAYEPYTPSRPMLINGDTVNLFADGMSARKPVAGTIARGNVPYHFENTNDDYERAGRELVNPYGQEHLDALATDKKALDNFLAAGKVSYNTYCAVCHGEKGKADGSIVESGAYPPPPSYFRDDIMQLSEGKMFHSIHYGKNLMGSYASQLTKQERWEVICYIRQMQAKEIAKNLKIDETAALKMITGKNTYNPNAAPADTDAAPAAAEEEEETKTEGEG